MKNRFFISLAATALMASFAACSNDTEDIAGGSSTVQFSATLVDNTATRAATDVQTSELSNGLEIGLFSTGLSSDANNAKLTAGSNNSLTAAEDLTWGTGSASFYAYAPYASDLSSDATALEFAVKDDQSADADYIASDLLYASKEVTKETNVNLAFQHKLSKVVINVTSNNDAITLSSPKVSLLNVDKAVSLTLASGEIATATDKKNGTIAVHSFGSDDREFSCAAVVAPQTIGTTDAFVRIENGDKIYDCKLGNSKELKSGKVYKFNVTFKGTSTETVTVTVEYDGATLSDWGDDDGTATTEDPEEYVTYTVGDYLLENGTFIQKAKVTASDNVIGVIFSTTVSKTDANAGYTAYILATKAVDSADPSGPTFAASDYSYATTIATAAAELDGLTQSAYANNAYFTFSDITLTTLDNSTFSAWFVPSVGQAIQILNNLGNAGIPTDATQDYYCVLPHIEDEGALSETNKNNLNTSNKTISANGNYLYALSPTGNVLYKALKEATNGVEVFSTSKTYAMASLRTSSNIYLLSLSSSFSSSSVFKVTDSSNTTTPGLEDSWGFSNGASSGRSNRGRIACIAVKSDKIVAPTAE